MNSEYIVSLGFDMETFLTCLLGDGVYVGSYEFYFSKLLIFIYFWGIKGNDTSIGSFSMSYSNTVYSSMHT